MAACLLQWTLVFLKMPQYTTVSARRQDFFYADVQSLFFRIANFMLLEKRMLLLSNIQLNCSFTMLLPCVDYAFNISV